MTVALPLACGGAAAPDAEFPALAAVTALAAGDSIGSLTRPIAFEGDIPCADCERIHTVLVLHPDGSSRERRRFYGWRVGPRHTLVSVGRWSISGDSVRYVSVFTSDGTTRYEVDGELRLRPVDADGKRVASRTLLELRRVAAPPVLAGRLEVRGEFRYFADAATFVPCDGGRQFPVGAQPGHDSAFIRLQRTHADHPLGNVDATTVDLVGELQIRPGAEDGTSVETVVVDSFSVVPEPVRCETTRTRALMAVGDWQLTALDGVLLGDSLLAAHRPTLRFALSEPGMFGNAGCNRFTGRAVLRGLDLVGGPLAMTRRFCADSMANVHEARYAAVLSAGGWFRLDGTTLVFSHQGREVARFVRR